MTEADFLNQVIDLAHLYKWRVAHFRPGQRSDGTWYTAIQGDAGFTDLVLVRQPRVIFAEVKSDKGRLSPEQRDWITALDLCPGVETFIWRPRMWDDIVGILRC